MFNFSYASAVIPAGIAGIQNTRMYSKIAIHGLWIPAIPAGMTFIF